LTALVGCKAIDAMDNTDTMKSDLAAMKQTTGGMAGTTNALDSNMVEAVRLAKVQAGMDALVKPENNLEYLPPQANMVVGAKLVAENMKSDELMQYLDGRYKELMNNGPDDSKSDGRLVGGYPASYVAKYNRKQQVQTAILQAIAGQIPQPMLQQLIQEQIYGGGGQYSDTLYAVLMLRVMFTNSFFLANGVMKPTIPMDTIGKVRDANTYINNIQFVASLPFQDKIKFSLDSGHFLQPVEAPDLAANDPKCTVAQKDPGCLPTLDSAPSVVAAMNGDALLKGDGGWWQKFANRIDEDALQPLRGGSSPYAHEIAEIKESALRNAAVSK
ncbi:MAG: hypothetical protein ACXVB9_13020, partial [Bdellovibrionota bacterium]